MEKIILLAGIVICILRTTSYGIYTFRDKNRIGAFSIFVLMVTATTASVYFLVR